MIKKIFHFFVCSTFFIVLIVHSANSQDTSSPSETTTEVVILGTIHKQHYVNPNYKPETIRDILLALEPAAILIELPLCQVHDDGRPKATDHDKYPENWATDTAAQQLGIRQIPFDRPDREDNFRKTHYFDRENRAEKLRRQWNQQITQQALDSQDYKIAKLKDYANHALYEINTQQSAKTVNSQSYDCLVRIKKSLWFDIMPEIYKQYPGYETLIKDDHFFRDQWNERNRIMADNILAAARQFPNQRIVVVTGSYHRYILRNLLKNEPAVQLKEFYEIINPETLEKQINCRKFQAIR